MSRRYFHCSQLLSCVEGSKDNAKWWKRLRHTRSGLTHNAGIGFTATINTRPINMLQPGTCYARPLHRQSNTCHFYEVHIDVLCNGSNARKHGRSPVPRRERRRWSVPRTQRRRMKRSCYRWKWMERTSHWKSLLPLRRYFPSPSPSCARVSVSKSTSMNGQMFRTNVASFVAAAAAVW